MKSLIHCYRIPEDVAKTVSRWNLIVYIRGTRLKYGMKYRKFSKSGIELDGSTVIKGRTIKLLIIVAEYNNPRKTITRRMWRWITDVHGLTPDFCGKWVEMGAKDYKRLGSLLLNYVIESEIFPEVESDILNFVKDLQAEVFDKLGHEV